ncbi:6444_t:CDS:2 [Dentiscutata erythropus]|uniref:6444_t:CDS:1 n=1 Tax=Dentiscutata erythropus TaxID=1348616 RepID=A0A9N9ICP7_9GLOM|nr:6444_t:CDS:2 [Dentiscutata erythropus]
MSTRLKVVSQNFIFKHNGKLTINKEYYEQLFTSFLGSILEEELAKVHDNQRKEAYKNLIGKMISKSNFLGADEFEKIKKLLIDKEKTIGLLVTNKLLILIEKILSNFNNYDMQLMQLGMGKLIKMVEVESGNVIFQTGKLEIKGAKNLRIVFK